MLNHKGDVAECTGDNMFLVKKGELLTPPLDAGVLDGVTRRAVMRLAEQAGMTVREITLQRHDVYVADECFLTGTAAEVIPCRVGGRKIGDGRSASTRNARSRHAGTCVSAFQRADGRGRRRRWHCELSPEV